MNAMKHEDATATKAVERYLLGAMSPDERTIFEEHYFDCADCAADVTDGTRMMIAGRSAVVEELAEARPPNPKRFQWFPAAAAASLIFTFLGGQAGYRLAMRRHEPTELVRAVHLDPSVVRGDTHHEIPVVLPGDDLRFDVQPSDDAVRYTAVVSCGGKTKSTHGISREKAAETVTLRLGELPAGRCELVIQGVPTDGKSFWIASGPFEVGER